MAWSPNRRPDSAEYRRNRLIALERDGYLCQLGLAGCLGTGDISDHITPVAEGGTDDVDNLRCVCSACHEIKTNEEKRRGIRRYHMASKRPPIQHPGLM